MSTRPGRGILSARRVRFRSLLWFQPGASLVRTFGAIARRPRQDPMPREATIPLVLWISTAALVHMMGGGGAVEAARTISDRASVRSMVSELRMDLAPDQGTIEVITDATQLTPRSEPNPAENPSAKPLDPPVDPPKTDDKKPPEKNPVPPEPSVGRKVKPPQKPSDRSTDSGIRLPLSHVAFSKEGSIAAARQNLDEYAATEAKRRNWPATPLVKSNEVVGNCDVYLDFGPLIGTE